MNGGPPDTARIVAFSGEEFQRLERMTTFLADAVDEATKDFNFDTFDADSFSLESFSELLVTFPMMAPRRVVVLRDFDSFHPQTRKKISTLLADVPDTTLVVCEGNRVTLSPKPPADTVYAESFKPVYENRLPSWIQERFARRGKTIDPQASPLLINNIGIGLRELDNEIEKITIVAGDEEHVTTDTVERVVGRFKRDTIWNLCNAVGLNDLNEAVRILRGLTEAEKNREVYYVSTLAAHITKIAAYNSAVARGVPPKEAMKIITDSPFLWKLNKMDRQTKLYSPAAARRALTALARLDSALKRSRMDRELTLELLLPYILPRKKRVSA